jgi:hypothetical protein
MHEGEIALIKDVVRVFKVGEKKAGKMREKTRRFFLKEDNDDVTIAQVRLANGLDARLNSLSIIEKQELIEVICTEIITQHRKIGISDNLNADGLTIRETIKKTCEKYKFNEYLIYRIMKGI